MPRPNFSRSVRRQRLAPGSSVEGVVPHLSGVIKDTAFGRRAHDLFSDLPSNAVPLIRSVKIGHVSLTMAAAWRTEMASGDNGIR